LETGRVKQMTLEELKEYLTKNVNEVDLLEVLDISAEELVEVFSDKIEENFDRVLVQFELGEEFDETDYE
jgi:hypothetical protein